MIEAVEPGSCLASVGIPACIRAFAVPLWKSSAIENGSWESSAINRPTVLFSPTGHPDHDDDRFHEACAPPIAIRPSSRRGRAIIAPWTACARPSRWKSTGCNGTSAHRCTSHRSSTTSTASRTGKSTLRTVEIEEVGDVGRTSPHLHVTSASTLRYHGTAGKHVTGDFSEPTPSESGWRSRKDEGIAATVRVRQRVRRSRRWRAESYDVVYTGGSALCWLARHRPLGGNGRARSPTGWVLTSWSTIRSPVLNSGRVSSRTSRSEVRAYDTAASRPMRWEVRIVRTERGDGPQCRVRVEPAASAIVSSAIGHGTGPRVPATAPRSCCEAMTVPDPDPKRESGACRRVRGTAASRCSPYAQARPSDLTTVREAACNDAPDG